MDREPEELQFLGLFGIYHEAYNIITSRRKIFSRITLAFILPLSFIYLAQTKISDLLFPKMVHNQEKELLTFFAYLRLSPEFTAFFIFKVIGRTPAAIDILSNIVVFIWAIGFVYISVIWHLASVVSVVEETYGYKAVLKSKALTKGKMLISLVIFIKLEICFLVVLFAFENLVAHGRIGVMGKVLVGLFCFLFLSILIPFALAIQTVVFFVCKSYHHENIDKSCLDEHLEAYNIGDYVPLIKDKDIQLEQSSE
ncbi:hypothetical protein C5167_037167, partial [Papaver somniferum]